ncbi:uncharacterized protein LOC135120103 isoform X1 [Zophobas morio]|uniref:uncharacterized protein LOC135120103 isoform X1 n=1 Tax=Zophobas morio TaxID=2755281 RepID=UPI0030835A40
MSVDEDFKKLIKCLKTMLTNVFDAKTANKIENNIIKTLVKAHFLTLDGKLKEDWWLELDKGLRSAFETVVRICDTVNSGRTIPESTLAEQLAGIQADLRNVGRLLHARLLPFVRPKRLRTPIRGGALFNYKLVMRHKELLKAHFVCYFVIAHHWNPFLIRAILIN